jgi:hypothetical protein
MKALLSLVSVAAIASGVAHAQIPVTDVANTVQDAANQVINLAEYVQMVSNQVEQINTMTQELQQVTAYVQAFGDPSSILELTGVNELVSSLQQSGVGQTYAAVRQLADGAEALTDNGQGLYQQIGQTFTLPSNGEVPRAADFYRKFDAVAKAGANYSAVYEDAVDRRQALKGQLATTTQQLQSASTDAETQKLTGVIAGQAAQLEAIDNDVIHAASLAEVQDIENRNDAEKQRQARIEEQQAEFSEAAANYGTAFQLSNEPPAFGGRR